MTTPYNVNSYSKGVNGYGLPFCDTVFTATLDADTASAVTIPGNATLGPTVYQIDKYLAVFSYEPGTSVFVAVNGTAELPTDNDFEQSNSELNPSCKFVQAADVLSFITHNTTANVSVAIYSFLGN